MLGEYSYEPTIFVGAHLINKVHKLELAFAGYVLHLLQGISPLAGRIVGLDGVSHKVTLEDNANSLNPFLHPLKEWIPLAPSEPAVILNKYCPYCEFKDACYRQAQQRDHLSLLKGISQTE